MDGHRARRKEGEDGRKEGRRLFGATGNRIDATEPLRDSALAGEGKTKAAESCTRLRTFEDNYRRPADPIQVAHLRFAR